MAGRGMTIEEQEEIVVAWTKVQSSGDGEILSNSGHRFKIGSIGFLVMWYIVRRKNQGQLLGFFIEVTG